MVVETKITSLVLVMLLVAAMLASVVAETAAGHGSITINNAVEGHTYTAYQIFKGVWDSETKKLSDIQWGAGITDDGKTALYALYELTGEDQTAAKVADALAAIGTDAAAVAFADAVDTNVAGGSTGTLSGTTYTISDLADGYYMVVDTYTPTEGEENVTYSRYMIQKVGNATVENKAETPTVDKDIVEGEDTVDQNTANIGDVVNYKVTSAVPDLTGYKEYYMDFSDKMLRDIRCLDNELTSLNVSGLSALIKLECMHNKLTNLDVKSNTALKYLDCSYNQLTSLNVNSNQALIRLSCESNQITTLDMRDCPQIIPYINEEHFAKWGNTVVYGDSQSIGT